MERFENHSWDHSWAERELAFIDEDEQEVSAAQHNVEVGASLGVDVAGGVPDLAKTLRVKAIHHRNLVGTSVYGSVHKVCWGSYNSRPACLLVVRFRFMFSSGIFRLRTAHISMRFDNLPLFHESGSSKDKRAAPVLRIFSPSRIYGIATSIDHELVWSVGAQCSVSVGPASAGPEASRESTTRYKTEAAVKIVGMDDVDQDKQLPNIAKFRIDENSQTSAGVPGQLYFGVVVQCDGHIQADIKTSIGDRSAWPWTRDDPIFLMEGNNYGDISKNMPGNFDELTDNDWKALVPYQEERTSVVQWRLS